ncbi:MAG: SpoIIE family protein phosphatase [Oscillospiraceae bacterium]
MTEYVKTIDNKRESFKWKTLIKFTASRILKCAISFILTSYSIGGEIFPFGFAFAIDMNGADILPVAITTAIGYWFFGKSDFAAKYLAALILGIVFKLCFFNENGISKRFVPFLALFSMSVPTLCITFLQEYNVYSMILSITELSLVFGASYFFSFALEAFEDGKEYLGKKYHIATVFLICIVVAAFESISFFNINMAIVLASFLISSASYFYGEAGGAIIGASLGACSVIMGSNPSLTPVFYSLGGLFSGLFKRTGKLSVAISFFLTGTLFIASSEIGNKIYTFFALLIGVATFLIIPSSIVKSILPFRTFKEKDATKAMCKVVQNKVKQLSCGLSEIKKTTDEVSTVTSCHQANRTDVIYDVVTERLCKYCPNNAKCWQDNYSMTYDIINRSIIKLKTSKEVSINDFPIHFKEICPSYSEVGEAITDGYHLYIKELQTQRQIDRLRWVVTEQLDGVSQMLFNLSENIDNLYSADTVAEARVISYFESKKSPPADCLCYTDKFDRLTIEVVIPTLKLARMDNNNTILDLSEICERDFAPPIINYKDNFAVLKYLEIANLKVDFGFIQKIADNNKICGDCCRQISEKDGFAYVILSDGMGTGKNAAIESTMTADMLCDLLTNGSDFESAVKLINSALICKSPIECFATVDIAALDLFSGLATFYKAAAAPTYIIKNGKASNIVSRSLPVGILKDISPEKTTATLKDGDIIVNLSDGATTSGEKWIISELELCKDKSPDDIAQHICNVAYARRTDGKEDDITVSVMKISSE